MLILKLTSCYVEPKSLQGNKTNLIESKNKKLSLKGFVIYLYRCFISDFNKKMLNFVFENIYKVTAIFLEENINKVLLKST